LRWHSIQFRTITVAGALALACAQKALQHFSDLPERPRTHLRSDINDFLCRRIRLRWAAGN